MPEYTKAPALTEAFTDPEGRAAIRYIADDDKAGIAAGSEFLLSKGDAERIEAAKAHGHMWPASHYDDRAAANLAASIGYAYRAVHADSIEDEEYCTHMAYAYGAMSAVSA